MSQNIASEARCFRHPEHLATGTCTRCGTFICQVEQRVVDGAPYCETCATHPEVDWLDAFRLKYWGKRDAWAWLIGLGSLSNLVLAGNALLNERAFLAGGVLLAGAAINAGFWLGKRWARLALLGLQALNIVLNLFTAQLPTALAALIGLLITVAILLDTRNKLFFKIEVSREQLKKAWNLYSNNQVARTGFLCSILGVLMPPLAPVGLLCSIIGLRRVDPTARPPIGRKGHAIAGIVVGGLATLGWVLFFGATALAG